MQHMTKKSTRKKRPVSPQEIHLRTLLLQRGLSVTELAARLRVSHAFVSMLISGKRRSREVENRICRILGLPRGAIWNVS